MRTHHKQIYLPTFHCQSSHRSVKLVPMDATRMEVSRTRGVPLQGNSDHIYKDRSQAKKSALHSTHHILRGCKHVYHLWPKQGTLSQKGGLRKLELSSIGLSPNRIRTCHSTIGCHQTPQTERTCYHEPCSYGASTISTSSLSESALTILR